MKTAPHTTWLPTRLKRTLHMGLHILYGLFVLVFIYRRLDRSGRDRRASEWSRRMVGLLGMELRIAGNSPGRSPHNTLLVANHVSWVDIFVLSSCAVPRFVAKQEIRTWPLIGWMVNAGGTLFIDRSNRRDASRVNAQMAEALRNGDCLAVFPESTTSEGDVLLPFKSSLFESALLGGSIVQPVTLRYLDEHGVPTKAPAYAGDTTFMQSLWAMVSLKRIIVEVTFGTPLTAGLPGLDTRFVLAEAAARDIRHHLRLSADTPDMAEKTAPCPQGATP